jgi:hypothetical protein
MFPNAVSESGVIELIPLVSEVPSNRPASIHTHILATVQNAMSIDMGGKRWREIDDRLVCIIPLLHTAISDTLSDDSQKTGAARQTCAQHAAQILRSWPKEPREIMIEKDGGWQYTHSLTCPRARQALFEWIVDAWVWEHSTELVALYRDFLLEFAEGPHMPVVLAALRKRDEHAAKRRVEALMLGAEAKRGWRDEHWVQRIIETSRQRWVRSIQPADLLFLVRLSHESGGALSPVGKEFLVDMAGKVRRLEQASRSFQEHVGLFAYHLSLESMCPATMTVVVAHTVDGRGYHATVDDHAADTRKQIGEKMKTWSPEDPAISVSVHLYAKDGSETILLFTLNEHGTIHHS